MLTLTLTMTCFTVVIIENIDATKEESIGQWYANTSNMYWAYIITVTILFALYTAVNFIFLEAVLLDFQRRNYVSKLLTEMLEIDVNRKTGVGVRMLSVNFMHPPSLLTWLEMRKMIFDIGARFFIRLQGDIIAFMILVGT